MRQVRAQASDFRIGRDYPHRIVKNLRAARVDSLRAVIEVRKSDDGRRCILPCGNEGLLLQDGRVARCITRIDYRTNSTKPITKQTIDEEKWMKGRSKSRRDNDPLVVAMKDCANRQARMENISGVSFGYFPGG
mmetsp:Transcript_20025/g.31801  ORF Transcript_20025/g.31801 Transcript_20025/m.31801 type:complete len:134 (+) Transcript_20025:35-436(+)